jgi:hypothetical protein
MRHSFQPMGDTQVSALLTRTAKAAYAGQYMRYKNTHHFDGTFHNPGGWDERGQRHH